MLYCIYELDNPKPRYRLRTMKAEFKTFAEFVAHFKDEATCLKYFETVRFAEGDYCPHCKHDKINRFSDGKRYRCAKCRKDFRIITNTLFGETKIPLQKWFIAIYLLTSSKKGISSIELADKVGTTQKTAWYMDHRIREALKQGGGKLFGTVEVDETYIGGKHMRQDGFRKKQAVMGMIERGGRVKAFHIEGRHTLILLTNILKNIQAKSRIMTDEALGYKQLHKLGFEHGRIKHGKKHWKFGKDTHTNTIESFWALFKRGTLETHHKVNQKHLQRYIDEYVFRFNRRSLLKQEIFEDVVNRVSKNAKLSYKLLKA